jgi:hypothetical protein
MHEQSSLARRLGSWVRIPLKARMLGVCMRLFCVSVVLCLSSCLEMGWSLVQGVLPHVKMIMELNKRPGPWMGCKSHCKNYFRAILSLMLEVEKPAKYFLLRIDAVVSPIKFCTNDCLSKGNDRVWAWRVSHKTGPSTATFNGLLCLLTE